MGNRNCCGLNNGEKRSKSEDDEKEKYARNWRV